MDIEAKINELSDLGVSFQITGNYYHVVIKYKDNWKIINGDDRLIHVEKRDKNTHYIGSKDEVSLSEIFKLIDETIEFNRDIELKLELFKTYTQQLQEIFAKETYKTLKTLKFSLKKPKSVKKIKKEQDKPLENTEQSTDIVPQKNENIQEENIIKEEENVNNI